MGKGVWQLFSIRCGRDCAAYPMRYDGLYELNPKEQVVNQIVQDDNANTAPPAALPPHILVACMPKSGSSFLSNCLSAYKGFRTGILVPDYGVREQEMCELRLEKFNNRAYVAQLHVRNSEWTQKLIQRYGITQVVLVRDLLDVVASIRDHIRKLFHFGALITLTERHRDISDDELDSLIVQFAMPWYISFYAGWRKDPKALFLNYEDVTTDPGAAISKIFDKAKFEYTAQDITAALAKVQEKQDRNRFNKGIKGRGQNIHSETRRKLIDLLAHYPEFKEDRIFKNVFEHTHTAESA